MTNRTRLTLSTIRSLSTPRVTKTTLPRPSRSLHGIPITTRAVPLSDVPITEASLSELRQLIDAPGAQPLLFRASATSDPTNTTSRASELLKNLRQGADRIVDVEYGRYDHAASGVFDRVPMRLQDYLDWLEDNTRESGSISGRQIYLAQWRAGDEIEAIRDTLKPPPMLTPLLKENLADMYQTSFFIGPTGAVTPLHYDPYVNLFHLQASSSPRRYAKHFTLVPPSISEHLTRTDPDFGLRNTSPHEFHILPTGTTDSYSFELRADVNIPRSTVEALTNAVLTCVLHEGDTLLIPKRWWHRAENVALPTENEGEKKKAGWTAGVAWWFLLRDAPGESAPSR